LGVGRFLAFLLESIQQNNQLAFIEKAEGAVNVRADFYANLI
jgi:hypothetical protein